jgi:hypothetical protein
MTSVRRLATGLLLAASVAVALSAPAAAEPKHVLLTQKVQLMATVGKASIQSHVGAIVANVEEQFARP